MKFESGPFEDGLSGEQWTAPVPDFQDGTVGEQWGSQVSEQTPEVEENDH